MCYDIKLWFKVQVSFLGKINEDDLVKNLQETVCVEVRLHTQYFKQNKEVSLFWLCNIMNGDCLYQEKNAV